MAQKKHAVSQGVSDPLKEVVQYRLMRREKGRHLTRKLPERFCIMRPLAGTILVKNLVS